MKSTKKLRIDHLRLAALILVCGIVFGCTNGTEGPVLPALELGQEAFEKGYYNRAIELWEQALVSEPRNEELILKIATAFQRQAQFIESNRCLNRIIDGPRPHSEAYVLYLQNLIVLRDLETAENVFKSIKRLQPKDYRLLSLEGDFETLRGQLGAGETLYRQAITINPENSYTYFKLAANLFIQKRLEPAQQYYRQALASKTNNNKLFWLHKAEYLTLTDRLPEAEIALKEALKADPDSLFIKIKIAYIYKAINKYDAIISLFNANDIAPGNTRIQKIIADAFLSINKLDEAHKILQIHENDVDHDWLLLWGKYHLLSGNSASAVSYLERALLLEIDDPITYYMLSLAYMLGNKYSLAQQALIQLLTNVPNYSDAELALADIHYKKGNYDLGIDQIRQFLKSNPDNFRAYLILGNCYLFLDRYEEAEVSFQNAIKLNNDSFDAQYLLALTEERRGHPENAMILLEELIAKKNMRIDALMKIGEIYSHNNKIKAALDIVRKRADNFKNGYLQMVIAQIYVIANEPNEAIHYYRKALGENHRLDVAYLNIVALEKDNKKKIELLHKASRFMPHSYGINTNLADLYLQEGDVKSATEIIEKLYSSDKSNPFLANNLAWLYLESETNLIKAFELALLAYGADGKNANFTHTMGVAYHRKGMLQRAEWYLREALVLADNQNVTHSSTIYNRSIFEYHLALLLIDSGNAGEAIELLKKSLNGFLPTRYAEIAKGLIKTRLHEENMRLINQG